MPYNNDGTIQFRVPSDNEGRIKILLTEIYDALKEKGHEPISQIVGYILSEDPGYITNHRNARSLIRHIDRYDLLEALVRNYLEN